MSPSDTLYCYRCGKRVKRGRGNCWYCNAPTEREIRPSRHCPFCDNIVAQKALKCHHCGEFIDGVTREQVQAATGHATHVTFVIDKAVIQGDQPLHLEGGHQVPPEFARLLSPQTVQAIQNNRPNQVDQKGVQALPAPEKSRKVRDVQALPDESHKALPGPRENSGTGAIVRRDEHLPATREEKQGFSVTRAASHALAKLTDRVIEAVDQKPEPPESPEPPPAPEIPKKETSPYANCVVCGTEILREDSYCFHCGTAQRKHKSSAGKKRILDSKSTGAIFGATVVILLLQAVLVWQAPVLERFDPFEGRLGFPIALGGLFGILLMIWAFFRQRTVLNQVFVVIFLFFVLLFSGLGIYYTFG
ncbi:hypothetical protein HQ520_17305 [bacterium]|nr:hypothetical protein [bacterium]